MVVRVLVLAAAIAHTGLAHAAGAPAAPAAPAPPAPTVQHVDPVQIVGLLGQSVVGSDKKEIGRIVDVLVDAQGLVRAAVVQVSGFLGMGDRQVAVEWTAVHFTSGENGPVVSITIPPDRIKAAPTYAAGRKVEILTAAETPPP